MRSCCGSARPGLALRRDRDELALGDRLDDLLLLLFLEAVVVRLGVAGHAHHPGGDALVADDDEAADDVALLPAHPLDVEPRQVDVGALAAPRAGLVVVLLGLADGLHVLRGCVDAHACSQSTPGLSRPSGSSAAFAARHAAANGSGRCASYQRRWSRPTAWWCVIVPPAASTAAPATALTACHCSTSAPRSAGAS